MIALTWNDVDFERKKITINKTFTNKIGNGSFMILDQKTTNSFRIIDLNDDLIKKLKNIIRMNNLYIILMKTYLFLEMQFILLLLREETIDKLNNLFQKNNIKH